MDEGIGDTFVQLDVVFSSPGTMDTGTKTEGRSDERLLVEQGNPDVRLLSENCTSIIDGGSIGLSPGYFVTDKMRKTQLNGPFSMPSQTS